jgi:hypothetical protein
MKVVVPTRAKDNFIKGVPGSKFVIPGQGYYAMPKGYKRLCKRLIIYSKVGLL